MPALVEAGAGLIGGCCGTTPEFIAAVRRQLDVLRTEGFRDLGIWSWGDAHARRLRPAGRVSIPRTLNMDQQHADTEPAATTDSKPPRPPPVSKLRRWLLIGTVVLVNLTFVVGLFSSA